MRISLKLKAALAVAALAPLVLSSAAHGNLADPAFEKAAAVGFASACLIALLGSVPVRLWLFGRGFQRIEAIGDAVKRGRYDLIPKLPTQSVDAAENEFVSVQRSLSWMAHRIANRESELRNTIAELKAAKDRLELQERALRDANGRLAVMARTDPLTGLCNRRYFFERLDHELHVDRDELSVLLLDIDHFKLINDTYGHQAGDAVLRELSARVRSLVRKTDVAARVGGEEFAVLLSGVGAADAVRIAGAVHEAIRSCEFDLAPHLGTTLRVTCSVGICALFDRPRARADLLYKLADDALYAAKKNGRDRLYAYDPRARTALPVAS